MLKVSSLTLVFHLIILLLACFSFAGESTLKPLKPIRIMQEEDFTRPDAGSGCECVTSGSGTSNDPYIIENWDIENSPHYGIYVGGTSSHFIIRGVKVQGVKRGIFSGIYLANVMNARIEGTTVINNKGPGVIIKSSSNNKLIGNTVKDNKGLGIGLFDSSDDNTLEGNTVTGNNWGIRLEVSNSNVLIGNTVTGNNGLGMFLRGFGNDYIGNTIKDNLESGINFDWSKRGVFIGNTVCDNKKIGIAFYSSESLVVDGNTICDNERGVYFEISTGNLLINNKVTGNEGDAILVMEVSGKENRFINNTVEDKVTK